MKQELHTQINWMDRQMVIDILQDVACIQCYDSESTDELRDTLRENIEDGTIEVLAN